MHLFSQTIMAGQRVPMQLFRAALVLQLCLVFVVTHRERAPSLRTRKLEDAALTLTCISTFDSLRDGLKAAQSNGVFTICSDTHVLVKEEILVNAVAVVKTALDLAHCPKAIGQLVEY
jgi:hypothetical protein